MLRSLWNGVLGGIFGLVLGVVLYLPACAVGTVGTLIGIVPPGKPGERTDIADAFLWICVVGGAIIGFVTKLIEESRAAQARADAQASAQAHERRVHQQTQQNCETELVRISADSLGTFEALPTYLLDAESLLDQAERNFEEGAFAPFWDSIEQAAVRLGSFDGGVTSMGTHAKHHLELGKVYERKSPAFPISRDSVKGLIAGNTTAERMKAIVRRAQRNFQFASIYEQRRTNQILIAGFNSLAQALDGMANKISQSIDDLSDQVTSAITDLGDQISEVNRSTLGVSESLQDLKATIEKDADQRIERHRKALEMLDNIQRRRIPYPRKSSDGTY